VKHDPSRNTVAIVIGVDDDMLVILYRKKDPLNRPQHIRKKEGVVEMGVIVRVEEECGGVRFA
jgi:hypothetical protein